MRKLFLWTATLQGGREEGQTCSLHLVAETMEKLIWVGWISYVSYAGDYPASAQLCTVQLNSLIYEQWPRRSLDSFFPFARGIKLLNSE